MIFKETSDQVLNGTKTQTRRPVLENDEYFCMLVSAEGRECFAVYRNNRLKWQVKKTYAVQPGRGKKALGRIRIKKIRQENLQDISIIDCYAEGIVEVVGHWDESSGVVNIREHFGKMWNRLYENPDLQWEANPEVWVLEFELV